MRMALTTDVTLLDPFLSGSKNDRQIYHNLYEPLLVLDEKLGIQPNLAESWQTPDSSLRQTRLRSIVRRRSGQDEA